MNQTHQPPPTPNNNTLREIPTLAFEAIGLSFLATWIVLKTILKNLEAIESAQIIHNRIIHKKNNLKTEIKDHLVSIKALTQCDKLSISVFKKYKSENYLEVIASYPKQNNQRNRYPDKNISSIFSEYKSTVGDWEFLDIRDMAINSPCYTHLINHNIELRCFRPLGKYAYITIDFNKIPTFLWTNDEDRSVQCNILCIQLERIVNKFLEKTNPIEELLRMVFNR